MIAAIFLAACTKENLNEQPLNESTDVFKDIRLVTLTDVNKSMGITMLEFKSIDHYEKTLAALEALVEEHEDSFLSTWSMLNEEDLNAKEEEVGFIYYQPLIDFENAYNIHSSMRQAFELAQAKWLNNEELDTENDPSNVYCFDMAEMTLLNADGEVKIGDFLLKLTNKGFVKIENDDVATLIRIKEGDLSAYLEPTVTTNIEYDGNEISSSDCKAWKGKDYWDPYQSNNKVKLHVHFHCYPWKGVSEAKITSYKKSGNKWKEYRMNLGVANQSDFRDYKCSNSLLMWSGWKHKNSKSIEKRNTSLAEYFPKYFAENGESVYGLFEYAGKSSIRVLVW